MKPTDTPRTDAEWQSVTASSPWDAAAEQMAQHARQLERELAELTEWREMLDREVGTLREELAAERAQLAANHGATRLMGKWLEDERALADRLADAVTDLRQLLTAHGQGCGTGREALAAWKEARREKA